MKQKAFSILLAVAMVFSMVPAFTIGAAAATAVSYRYPEYVTQTGTAYEQAASGIAQWHTGSCTDYEEVTDSDTAVSWGTAGEKTWYVVKGEVTIQRDVTVYGDVRLILADNSKLTIYATGVYPNNIDNEKAAICVSGDGNSLTIYGQSEKDGPMGALAAYGGNNAAAIGGNKENSGNNITINGGEITAVGSTGYYSGGAGIGGGQDGAASNITFNGGIVNASAGAGAAGIGGGHDFAHNVDPDDCSGTKIVINGGIVRSTSGNLGAAIGGGSYGNGTDITINGGTVMACCDGHSGTGIGGGAEAVGSNITVNGGYVNAFGGRDLSGEGCGSGIGGGTQGTASSISVSPALLACAGGDSEVRAAVTFDGSTDLSTLAAFNKRYVSIGTPACEIGSVQYPTLSTAIGSVTDAAPATIRLLSDIIENVTIPSGCNITLDLNDKVLNNYSSSAVIRSNGTLTVTDTAAEKTTRYFTDEMCSHGIAVGEACTQCGVCEHGVMIGYTCHKCGDEVDEESVTEEIARADGSYETYTTVEPDDMTGVLTVTGGCITGSDYSGIDNRGIFTFAGGSIVGINGCGRFSGASDGGNAVNNSVQYSDYSNQIPAPNTGIMYMTGGTIIGNSAPFDGGGIHNIDGTLTMTGGTVTGNTTVVGFRNGIYSSGTLILGGTAKITGNNGDNLCSNLNISLAGGAEAPAAGMNVSLSLYDEEVKYFGVFAHDAKDYADYFHSDMDSCMICVEGDDLALRNRLTQQPTDDDASVVVNTEDLAALPTYQWYKVEESDLEESMLGQSYYDNFDSTTKTYTPLDDGDYFVVFTMDDSYSAIKSLSFDLNTFGAPVSDLVTGTELNSDGHYTLSIGPITLLGGISGFALMGTNSYSIKNVKALAPNEAEGQTTNTLTAGNKEEAYLCIVTFADGSTITSNTVTLSEDIKQSSPSVDGVVSTYAVSANTSANGIVTASSRNTYAGNTVTLSINPDKGYTLDSLTVKDATGNAITLTVKKIGETYTFTMPYSAVTISATFKSTQENVFVDVYASDYYYDAVRWAAANGITGGIDATHFAPTGITTRSQMVTFLWRTVGSPEPTSEDCPFTDLNTSGYYYKAVLWGYEKGLIKGISDTQFAPDDNVTRGQAVAFLARFVGIKDDATGYSHGFTDVLVSDYFNNAVAWAATNKLTTGTTTTTFGPNNGCLRGEIVTFLYRNFFK